MNKPTGETPRLIDGESGKIVHPDSTITMPIYEFDKIIRKLDVCEDQLLSRGERIAGLERVVRKLIGNCGMGERHSVLCNYPTDKNGWCNCGLADAHAILASRDDA